MKTIFKTMSVAAAVMMVAGCGNQGKNQPAQQVAVVEEFPSVTVEQVFVQKVPQISTYTSTVQPYVKNNIVPQMAGRITKVNVEIGDRVKKGQILAEIDKAQLEQTLGQDFISE